MYSLCCVPLRPPSARALLLALRLKDLALVRRTLEAVPPADIRANAQAVPPIYLPRVLVRVSVLPSRLSNRVRSKQQQHSSSNMGDEREAEKAKGQPLEVHVQAVLAHGLYALALIVPSSSHTTRNVA